MKQDFAAFLNPQIQQFKEMPGTNLIQSPKAQIFPMGNISLFLRVDLRPPPGWELECVPPGQKDQLAVKG